MKSIRVATDHWNFETSAGDTFVPLGGNMLNDEHPGQGTLFRHFDAADCDRRFGIMAEAGLNVVRQAIGVNEVFAPVGGLKLEGLKNWDTFIGLAEKHGVYLNPVGGYLGSNDWFDVEVLADSGRALDESCAFWTAFCGHYRDHPAIFAWDLRNELLYNNRPHMTTPGSPDEARVEALLRDGWTAWLEARYGSVAVMNRVYGSAHSSFDVVPGSSDFEEAPFDPRAFDFRNYLNQRGHAWCKAQCDAIRAASPAHMICQGNNTWLSPHQNLWLANGFHNRANHELFDFVTHHPYPAWEAVPEVGMDPLDDVAQNGPNWRFWRSCCIAMSRFDHYNKPVVLQEWGWYGGGTSRFLCDLPYRSEEEHAVYAEAMMHALQPHTVGFINWPTFDMPASNDISNHGGIFTRDGGRKALTDVYHRFAQAQQGRPQHRQPATVTLQFSLLGLYTCRAYQDEMWLEVNRVIDSGEIPDFRFV